MSFRLALRPLMVCTALFVFGHERLGFGELLRQLLLGQLRLAPCRPKQLAKDLLPRRMDRFSHCRAQLELAPANLIRIEDYPKMGWY